MTNDELYDAMLIMFDDAPEFLGEYYAKRAEELGVSLEYFLMEFI